MAQHFATPTGQHRTVCNQKNKLCGQNGQKACEKSDVCAHMTCVEVRDPAPLRTLNTRVTGVMRAAAISVLPAFEASLRAWGSHTARVPYARAQLDCTHFCEPAPIFQLLTSVTLVYLQNSTDKQLEHTVE